MAQRQFRSDDTSVWIDRYGTGSAGALTVSANTTDTTPNTTITGTSGTTAATVGSGTNFSNGDLVIIVQTRGTNSDVTPNWELNKISSGGGTTSWTMAYQLTNNYSSGSQVYKLFQYSSVTVNTGVTLTGQAWSSGGLQGGVLALLSNGSATISGALSVTGLGFTGGLSGHTTGGYQGEGYPGIGSQAVYTANGNGAGGTPTSSLIDIQGGAGGGNSSAGGLGTNSTYTTAGQIAADSTGTILMLGGGGGGGETKLGSQVGSSTGGAGGGLIIIIAKDITLSASSLVSNGNQANGIQGESTTVRTMTAGSGAGGYILLKGQSINGGPDYALVTGGASTPAGGSQPFNGGPGGNGYVHTDYSKSSNLSLTKGSLVQRLDGTLADQAGALFFTGAL